MNEDVVASLIDAAIAVGIGLAVGLEREHEDVERRTEDGEVPEAGDPLLGVRTFALFALLGWGCSLLVVWSSWIPAAAIVVVGALLAVQYLCAKGQRGLGLTTEVAALVTFVLGMIVSQDRMLAVGLGLATTALLISKPWVRRLVPKLRRVELTATLQLAILLAVVLPLLPEQARDPWGVLPPRKIGLFVVLISGISYVGYVLTRIFGARLGTGLAGLVGGLASSTAVTVSMAQQARKAEAMIGPARLATLLANGVMFARVIVIAAVLSREVALALAPALGAMFGVTIAAAGWQAWRLRGDDARRDDRPALGSLRNPFALLPAIKWAIVLSVVLVGSAVARQYLGDQGLYAAAAASGLADVDAITLAVTRDAALGQVALASATLAVSIAVFANTIVKSGIAVFSGGRRFGAPVAGVLGAAMVVGVAIALLV